MGRKTGKDRKKILYKQTLTGVNPCRAVNRQKERKIDISQMAEDLGVSKTTVSRALSGNGRVSEATRARVVQYAKEKTMCPICWHAGW